ncbi:MAG: XdhC family protein [Coriobacteriales bacterium]|jgi:xanthine dehydrogenase accessory factor|nr:XdhC family protein [Coriobacteriales bacterium]
MQAPTHSELICALQSILDDLQDGKAVQTSDLLNKVFTCFAPEALAGDPDIKPSDFASILASLDTSDIPTFAAALKAAKAGSLSWLGFKIVTDPSVVLDSTDSSAWNFNGPGQGSANTQHAIFFIDSEKEIITARPFSPRDIRQAKDITSGPHMHNRQYAGVAWTSLCLEPVSRVIMLGCGDVSVQLESIAQACGFATIAVDDDAEYLNELRFPLSQHILLESFGDTAPLDAILLEQPLNQYDYICVLTRGHMHDTESIVWAVQTQAGYIGMMGNPMKNAMVYEKASERGIAAELLKADRLHAPIGIALGDKSPAGLAVSIVAELLKIRSDRRSQS